MAIDALVAVGDALFGAGTAAEGAVAAGATDLLGGLGVGSTTAGLLGDAVGSGFLGAGGGALLGGITGGDPGIGALTGFLGGGLGSLGGAAGADLGMGSTAGAALGAAAGGAGAAGLTGGNVGTGALEGAAGSLLSSAASGLFGGAAPAGAGAGGGGGGGAVNSLQLDPSVSTVPDLTGGDQLTKALGTQGASAFSGPAGQVSTGASVPTLDAGNGAAGFDVNTKALGTSSTLGNIAPSSGGAAPGGAILSPGAQNFVDNGLSAPTGGNGGLGGGSLGGAAGPSSGKALFGDITAGNISNIPGDIGSLIEKNPGAAISALGLGYSALSQPSIPGGQLQALTGQANQLASQGQTLQSYLFNGQLPQGAQTALDQATASASASVKQDYARMGLSGSSAEAQALASVRNSAAAQKFQLAQQLLQTGINETGLSSSLYENIYKASQQENQGLMQAIASFAAAAAGGGGGIQLKLSGGG